jgi:hypothetical protein
MKVILKLDVYQHDSNEERFWERQVWVGSMPEKKTAAECEPLVLLKEYENGGEHILFRLDDFRPEKGEVVYRPTILHHSDPFLKSLPQWGFKMEPIVNREAIK